MIIWVCIRISHAVGKVTKIVIFKKAADDYETNIPVSDDEKKRFLELKRRVLQSDPQSNFGQTEEKIYFVDKFYETNYKNVGKMGIMGSKKFFSPQIKFHNYRRTCTIT